MLPGLLPHLGCGPALQQSAVNIVTVVLNVISSYLTALIEQLTCGLAAFPTWLLEVAQEK